MLSAWKLDDVSVTCDGSQITDSMFAAAAQRLADYVTPDRIAQGDLYPELEHLRDISLKVRTRVSFSGNICGFPHRQQVCVTK